MKNITFVRVAVAASLCLTAFAGILARTSHAHSGSKPGGPGDHLIVVGKRTVWASQVAPKPARPAAAKSVQAHAPEHEFIVIENKRAVRKDSTPKSNPIIVSQPHIKTDGHIIVENKTVRWIEHDASVLEGS